MHGAVQRGIASRTECHFYPEKEYSLRIRGCFGREIERTCSLYVRDAIAAKLCEATFASFPTNSAVATVPCLRVFVPRFVGRLVLASAAQFVGSPIGAGPMVGHYPSG